MSLWPEDGATPVCLERTIKAYEALALGPDENEPIRDYIIGLGTIGRAPPYELRIREARKRYFPGPGKPTHVLFWTAWGTGHIFDYGVVEYIYTKVDKDVQRQGE